jgi:peptidoglycan/xylan/chitin deacetylase (PgdA/CDA1 family)
MLDRSRSLLLAALCATPLVFYTAGCGVPAADAEDSDTQEARPGWRWTEQEILETVNRVRAGRNLTPDSWPGGARVAVLLSFDVDNETVTGLRYGDATVGSLSQGEYGARVALGRVLDLLDRNEIPASFFIPAWSLRLSPQMADAIAAPGRHEFGVHGWIHELNSSLEADEERELLEKAIAYLTEITGSRPIGYRAPSWNFSPNTLSIIRELGFLYDSSLMADDRPYELLANGEPTGMVELPVEWILDDAPLLNPRGNSYTNPRDIMQVWIDEFDRAYEERTMFLLTMHPHYIGKRSRIVALEGLIDHIASRPGVWFGTHAEAVRWVKQKAGMS